MGLSKATHLNDYIISMLLHRREVFKFILRGNFRQSEYIVLTITGSMQKGAFH